MEFNASIKSRKTGRHVVIDRHTDSRKDGEECGDEEENQPGWGLNVSACSGTRGHSLAVATWPSSLSL